MSTEVVYRAVPGVRRERPPVELARAVGAAHGVDVADVAVFRGPAVAERARSLGARAFTSASVVAVLFSAAFAAMLLSLVLWDQQVWGWSALRTGLAFAPGPMLVPVFAFLVAGRLIRRFGPGPVIEVPCTPAAAG